METPLELIKNMRDAIMKHQQANGFETVFDFLNEDLGALENTLAAWTPIEESSLVKDEMINFIERNNGDGLHPPTQTVHKGWMENQTYFYSECADKCIEASKVTHILKIPTVPNL